MRLSPAELTALVDATETCPHRFLGLHSLGDGDCVVRCLLPGAEAVEVRELATGAVFPMERLHAAGLFEQVLPGRETARYRLRATYADGPAREIEDPYRFWPTISEDDLFLLGKGDDHRVYHKLGAQLRTLDGVAGVSFAVWAPSARRVSVVGDFNLWNGRAHPMRALGASGIWELFVPGVVAGARYKFELVGPHDRTPFLKTDPYGLHFEPSPNHAAIVCDLAGFVWNDAGWMESRRRRDPRTRPMSVYEVHLASWRRVPEEGGRVLGDRELG
ncbi:MAG: GlgB N-terminal domain-containing protein, partial [Opitutia bacterium]